MTRWHRRAGVIAAIGLCAAGGTAFVVHRADVAAIADIQGFTQDVGWRVTSQHVALRTYRNPLPWEPTWGYIPRRGMHYGGGPAHWVSGFVPHPVLEMELERPLNASGRYGKGCITWDPLKGAQGGGAQEYLPSENPLSCGFGNESTSMSR
jgi:hypothetical protein